MNIFFKNTFFIGNKINDEYTIRFYGFDNNYKI